MRVIALAAVRLKNAYHMLDAQGARGSNLLGRTIYDNGFRVRDYLAGPFFGGFILALFSGVFVSSCYCNIV